MKKIRSYLYITVIIAVAVTLIFNELLVYGLITLGIGLLAFFLWQERIKSKDNQITELKNKLSENENQLTDVKNEVEELRNRRLKISDIKSILDLGLLEINTNFTRTWNKQFAHNKQEIHFIGALRVNIIAKFGINLQELRFKFNRVDNEIIVANAQPKFLSFTDLEYVWEISELLEYKKPFLGTNHWKKTEKLESLGHSIKEDLQNRIHAEVKNGPEELDWVLQPLKKQIANSLDLLLGANGRNIILSDDFDDSFLPLEKLSENMPELPQKHGTNHSDESKQQAEIK